MGKFSHILEAKNDTLEIPFLKILAVNDIDNEDIIFLILVRKFQVLLSFNFACKRTRCHLSLTHEREVSLVPLLDGFHYK